MEKFNICYKEFNGKLKIKDIIPELLKEKDKRKPKTKEELRECIKRHCMYHYWAKCEWEFVIVDWPPKGDSINDSHPIKVDVWKQIEMNLDLIVDLIWKQ